VTHSGEGRYAMQAPVTGHEARDLVERLGGRFSQALGIDLNSRTPGETYKWFLAAVLFGARISETIAARTYREFVLANVVSPQAVLETGWYGLVEILDRGGYVRYDYKTATKLLDVNKALTDQYAGSLYKLHEMALDLPDLEQRIRNLGKGIGEITANIFLREMRGIWPKAEPLPSGLVIDAAKALGFISEDMQDKQRILALLQEKWWGEGMDSKHFADFEAALVRYGKIMRKTWSAARR